MEHIEIDPLLHFHLGEFGYKNSVFLILPSDLSNREL